LAVPVQEFENTLRRLRGLAVRVLNESASGEDVTDQYVDLQSRLRNLEATRDRIRTFLDQAATVNEALNVNRELSEIEDQIEQVKGRLNYLRDRAAFSTITVTLTPLLPTPTPTPTPTPEAWRPGETVQQAGSVLVTILKGLTELAIWAIIVLGPFAVVGAVGLWLLARWVRRLRRRAESRATPNEKMDQEETQ
jgi:ABC-type transporter Mla subunit MlaD